MVVTYVLANKWQKIEMLQKYKKTKINNKNAENRLTLYIYIYNTFVDLEKVQSTRRDYR